jgi:hypothetical protein
MYERFTDRAREVMHRANQEAQRLHHGYIGTEHILLGLAGMKDGVAIAVIKNFGIEPLRIKSAIERIIQSGSETDNEGEMPRSPRAKSAIGFTVEEARNLKHTCIGTEHVLLGLMREEEGVAAQVLMTLGLRLDRVREEVYKVLAQPNDWGRQDFAALPPLQSRAERAKVVDIPAACPKCGDQHIARVLWNRLGVLHQDIEDFKAGRSILGSISEMQGPAWVCLRCSPRWSEVHKLAMQDWEWQVAKEKAIESTDFVTAAEYRDDQRNLRQGLWELVLELQKD